MNNMKKIILILSMLLLSGCVTYDVSFDHNLKAKEDMTFVISEEEIFRGDILRTRREIDDYSSYFSNYFEIKRHGNLYYISSTVEPMNIDDFFKSSELFSQYLNAKLEINDDSISISGNLHYNVFCGEALEALEALLPHKEYCYGPVKINLHFQHRVLEHNADIVNERTNTYTWTVNLGDDERDFNITISDEKLWGIIIRVFFANNYPIMIGIIVVMGLGIVGYKLFYKYKEKIRKNKKAKPQFPF